MLKTLKIIFASLLTLIGISGNSLCLASPLYNSDLQARIVLDPALKPDNSPGAIISQETLKGAGSEAYFGNYMLQLLAGALITVAAPIAIIIIAIGGLFAVISHGDPGLMGKAKKTVEWAVIGLIIIIFSWVIIRTTLSIIITTNSNNKPGTGTSQTGATGGSSAPGGSGAQAPAGSSVPPK